MFIVNCSRWVIWSNFYAYLFILKYFILLFMALSTGNLSQAPGIDNVWQASFNNCYYLTSLKMHISSNKLAAMRQFENSTSPQPAVYRFDVRIQSCEDLC